MRPAVRLAALMDIDTIYVWTHDSIGLGEDGPTTDRASGAARDPAVGELRPADASSYAWRTILARRNGSGPVGPIPDPPGCAGAGRFFDAGSCPRRYVLVTPVVCNRSEEPDVILIATGSEVQLRSRRERCWQSASRSGGVDACLEWLTQPDTTGNAVRGTVSARVAVEARRRAMLAPAGWRHEIVSIGTAQASADHRCSAKYGFTAGP